MRTLSVLIKPVSGLCNLNCSYCFYADEMKNRERASFGRMDLETLEQLYRKIAESAPLECNLAFQGGEPMLAGIAFYEEAVRLQKKYLNEKCSVHYAIQTNGIFIDRQWCAFWREQGVLVGLSLDGIKATHDVYRKDAAGNGTWEKVMRGARLLQEQEVPFNVLTVVNARTAPRIRRIYEAFRKNGFRWQQYIPCLEPLKEADREQSYSLTPELYGHFLVELFDLWDQDLQKGKQPYIRQFESYIALLLGQQPEACEQRGTCSFQNVIEADGSIYPCDFYVLDEWRSGNVWDPDFTFDRMPETGSIFLKEETLPQKCRQCRYYALCRNGCRRLGTQQPNGENRNRFCSAYLYFFERRHDRLREIAAAVKTCRFCEN